LKVILVDGNGMLHPRGTDSFAMINLSFYAKIKISSPNNILLNKQGAKALVCMIAQGYRIW